jgi:hypothetical protein
MGGGARYVVYVGVHNPAKTRAERRAGEVARKSHLPSVVNVSHHETFTTLGRTSSARQAAGALTLATYPRTSEAGSVYASPSVDSIAVMYSSAQSGNS